MASALIQDAPSRPTAATAMTPEVTATPTVAMAVAGQNALRSMARSVFRPPSNRMVARAMLPIR